GLDADTVYHWAIEEDSVLGEDPAGTIRTFPPEGQPASFMFAAASCGQTGSTAASYSRILDRAPLFFMHMGDLHYENIDTNNPALFRGAFESVLDSAPQSALYQNVPVAYM